MNARAVWQAGGVRSAGGGGQREDEPESRAFAHFAVDANLAAHQFHVRRLQIASPKPLPASPNSRLVEPSIWLNL